MLDYPIMLQHPLIHRSCFSRRYIIGQPMLSQSTGDIGELCVLFLIAHSFLIIHATSIYYPPISLSTHHIHVLALNVIGICHRKGIIQSKQFHVFRISSSIQIDCCLFTVRFENILQFNFLLQVNNLL
ncbi:Hypothetical_protein [Hexamita inflata]|uniref:Hypothetical_protein n=1 Tax=Hexamita inflata TaxID=28002 RepID=A0AA86P782_9EUKA|nr:Hypothetical protein HINF_LOCUS20608 [Hexamita inflata]